MSWNDVVSSVRERIRRSLGRSALQEIQIAKRSPKLEGVRLATAAVDVYEN